MPSGVGKEHGKIGYAGAGVLHIMLFVKLILF